MKIYWQSQERIDPLLWNEILDGAVFGIVFTNGGEVTPCIMLKSREAVSLSNGASYDRNVSREALVALDADLRVRIVLKEPYNDN